MFRIVRKQQLRKILVFFNARSLAESFSQKIAFPPFEDRVFMHHASLRQTKREEVERAMNQSYQAILLATSTLELGIDIGDVDALDVEGKILNLSNFQMPDLKFPIPRQESIKKVIAQNIARFEDALGSGAFFYDLPFELQVEDHLLNLDIG